MAFPPPPPQKKKRLGGDVPLCPPCPPPPSKTQGRANHEVLKVPNSRFALHGLAPPQFTACVPFLPLMHGLCAFFRVLLTPLSTAPSPLPSQFTVCTSRFLAFLLTIGAFLLTILVFYLQLELVILQWEKVRLIRAFRDCKQRSLTVSKKSSNCK